MKIDREQQDKARQQVEMLLKSTEHAQQQQRLAYNIAELRKGKAEPLRNDETMAHLPGYIAEILREDGEQGRQLLDVIGNIILNHDPALRKRAIMTISLFTEKIIVAGNFEFFPYLASLYSAWLASEREFVHGLDPVWRQVGQMCGWLLSHHFPSEAELLLEPLHRLATGSQETPLLGNIAGKTLASIGTQEILSQLFTDCLQHAGEEKNQNEILLLLFGKPALQFLVETLRGQPVQEERERARQLLIRSGRSAVPVLRSCLEEEASGDVLPELIRITGEIGDDSLYPLVETFLSHHDRKVQKEVIACISRLGGPHQVERLQQALPQVDDKLKSTIIRWLVKTGSPQAVAVLHEELLEAVEKRTDCEPELIITLMIALGKFPIGDNLDFLHLLRKHYPEHFQDGRLKLLADETLRTIGVHLRHKAHLEEETVAQVSYLEDPSQRRLWSQSHKEFEQEIAQLLEEKRVEQAVQVLFSGCLRAAGEKDFSTAEMLRDRILELNPKAYEKIIEAEKIINRERKSKIPRSFLAFWGDLRLRNRLGEERFAALFDMLQKERYHKDERIIREGEKDDCLYFIYSGSVAVSCHTGMREMFLKRLNGGEIIGTDQFFAISTWTIAARAQTEVELFVLHRQPLLEAEHDFPDMEKILHEYCRETGYVPDIEQISGGDRRNYPRYRLSIRIATMLLDAYGSTGHRSLVGELEDISQGGFCFTIRIANRENARLLLGREVRVELPVDRGQTRECDGLVVGVHLHDERHPECRVHVRLPEPLPLEQLKSMITFHGK